MTASKHRAHSDGTANGDTRHNTGPPGDEPWHATNVVRTLWPPQPGTRRWRERFGGSLVCVRYRHDLRHGHRYTTVELLVDHAPVRIVRGGRKAWELDLEQLPAKRRRATRNALLHAGAEWDPVARIWRLSLMTAKRLGLADKVRRAGESQ